MIYWVLDLLWTINYACANCLLVQLATAAILSHCQNVQILIDSTIVDKIIPTSKPALLSSGQTNDMPAKVNANPCVSRWPKRTIKPKLWADQTDISDNECANSDRENPKASREWLSVLNWVVSQRRPLHILIEVTSKCGWIDLSKEPYVRSQCGRMRQNFLPCMILAADNLLLSGPKSDQSCGWTVHGHDFALSGTWSASQIF
jgi:hypothetical protein